MKVFDSSALLALIFEEPGSEVAAELMAGDEAVLSSVNLTEVLSRLRDVGVGADEAESIAAALPLNVLPFTAEHAQAAARLRPVTRHLGLSLGDRCCLALAQAMGAEAVTADRPWQGLAGHRITLIR